MDLENVSIRVKQVLQKLGRDESEINHDEIETFCKHAGYLKVIRYRSLKEEYLVSPRIKLIRLSFLEGC
jgi:NEDD8-activating enzyme E1 regulatory subunit